MATCSICLGEYEGYGNNARPVNNGRCCDECNGHFVIPMRRARMLKSKAMHMTHEEICAVVTEHRKLDP